MKLKLQTRGFTASQELTKLLYQKVARLAQFFDNIIVAEVRMSSDKWDIKESKVCNIRLVIPGNDLLANAQCKTFEEAIADAVEALKRQIEKRKTKLNVTGKSFNKII
ncbi:MAG: ribosome-associated translation inhibitor RaiA [Ferruginibacter sp.]